MVSLVRVERSVELSQPPDAVWPLVADTDFLDRGVGNPAIRYRFEPVGDGSVRTWGQGRFYGMLQEWEEKPFEWTRPYGYEVERVFPKGLVTGYRFGATLTAVAGGTRISYWGTFAPRSALLAPIVRLLAGRPVVRHADVLARFSAQHPSATSPLALGSVAIDRPALTEARRRVEPLLTDLQRGILDRLVFDIEMLDDRLLRAMRPFTWAEERKFPRIPALDVFLHATGAGLLEMEWALLCPHCRGMPSTVASPAQLPETGDCPACAVQFKVDPDDSVEARFTVSPRIRPTEGKVYCRGGPMNSPFLWAQVRVPVGGERTLFGSLPAGRYQMKIGGRTFSLSVHEGAGDLAVDLPPGREAPPERLGAKGALRFRNRGMVEVAASIEDATWEEGAATVALVSKLPGYREHLAG